MLEVIQADRDAAAEVLFGCNWHADTKAGLNDNDRIVQAFARHRIEATTAYQGRVERLEEALRPFAHYCDINDCDQRTGNIEVPVADLRRARAAISTAVDGKSASPTPRGAGD